jgi:hypothetical protein
LTDAAERARYRERAVVMPTGDPAIVLLIDVDEEQNGDQRFHR